MAPNGDVNGKAVAIDVDELVAEFSWLDAHPIFVIILVGPEEQPFGIQKDFLCARSRHFREHFAHEQQEKIEHVVNLPKTPTEVFACAQNFLYTGQVFPKLDNLPSYEVLIGVWKLGHELGIDGLCDRTLEAMAECRRVTSHIPATPLLVQVWKDTPEGSSIRKLLLEWAAEYMRSSDSRAEFARSLPQEVLSELVVAMSSIDLGPAPAPAGGPGGMMSPARSRHHSQPTGSSGSGAGRKNVHYLDSDDIEEMAAPGPSRQQPKKQRHSDVLPNGHGQRPPGPAKKSRASLPASTSKPGPKPAPAQKRRTTNNSLMSDHPPSTDQKMNFCADLLSRMLSGPGFWTRLVGPFKEPVDPDRDEVPDYLQRIKKPMDLTSMKAKMDRKEYLTEEEFLSDMHQIFTNCYTYWTKKDPMWTACEKLEKTFEEKYSQMNKWIGKMEGVEV